MVTQLRRIQVSLPDSLSQTLVDLADIKQVPISKVIVSLLSEMEPMLKESNKYARLLKQGQVEEAKRVVQHMMGTAMAEIIHDQAEVVAKNKRGSQ